MSFKYNQTLLVEGYQFLRTSIYNVRVVSSVTRLGDLVDFGQLFKANGNN